MEMLYVLGHHRGARCKVASGLACSQHINAPHSDLFAVQQTGPQMQAR